MHKDNETVPPDTLTTDESTIPTAEPFAPEQMVRCDECLRANPPTRVNCLYCRAVLPLNDSDAILQKPTLRPLEKWEQGYNNILMSPLANPLVNPGAAPVRDAAGLLRLHPEDLARILSAKMPLPLARAATMDEASLVQRRLSALGIETSIVADAEPGTATTGPLKVRTMAIDDERIYAYQTPESPAIHVSWSDLVLLVAGRLTVRRIEVKEERARQENRILESSQFASDEAVVDFYTSKQEIPYRIAANSFDFSCLGNRKSLVAGENIVTLIGLFREFAPQLVYDDSFNSVRKLLEAVWPSEQQHESSGWHRERPGKYSIGSAAELSNETQFWRYSRLRYHLLTETSSKTNADA